MFALVYQYSVCECSPVVGVCVCAWVCSVETQAVLIPLAESDPLLWARLLNELSITSID